MRLLSIVTINFNTAYDLSETIDSLSGFIKEYDEVEHIIVDGLSIDGSVELAKSYCPDVLVSEPDKGIYDAMNKGIKLSSGKFISFLNAGDKIISENVFSKALEELNGASEDIVSFGKQFIDFKGQKREKIPKQDDLRNAHLFMPLIHQGLCVSRNTYSCIGFYDLQFSIVADSEWLLRYLIKNEKVKIKFTDFCLVDMSRGGVSDVASSLFKRALEHYRIRDIHGYSGLINIFLTIKYFITRRIKYFLKDLV